MWAHTCCCCMGIGKLCYAIRNSPQPRCSVLELAFSTAEIRSFSKANSRLSATWNMSLLDLLLVYIGKQATAVIVKLLERCRASMGLLLHAQQ